MKRIVREAGKIILAVLIVLCFMMLLSCKTKTIYVPVETKTVITETVRDTVIETIIEYIRDSVIISADSVSFLSNKYVYSYAEAKDGKLHHSLATWPDAILPVRVQYIDRHRIDSVPAPYPVEVKTYVEKELNAWQKLRMRAGEVALIALLIALAYMIFKKKLFS